jgi:hypothetical protein
MFVSHDQALELIHNTVSEVLQNIFKNDVQIF